MAFNVPHHYRVTVGAYQSSPLDGNNGMFFIPIPEEFKVISRRMARRSGLKRAALSHYTVIASDGKDWEHVSVSLPDRCLTWEEMCFIKGMFWGEEDAVMQIHPRKSEYVNNHPYTLHLWRPMVAPLPLPPTFMVGVKGG